MGKEAWAGGEALCPGSSEAVAFKLWLLYQRKSEVLPHPPASSKTEFAGVTF